MLLHILAVLISQVILFMLSFYNAKMIKSNNGHFPVLSRLSFCLMLIISQSIFIYLLIKFQKPFQLKNRKTRSSSQLKSYRSDSAESSLETIIRRNVVKNAREPDMNDSFRWADNEEALDAALYVQYLKTSFVQGLSREVDLPP